MSPEFLKEDIFTPKSDVYSFGVIMWEVVHRVLAWENYNDAQLTYALCFKKETLTFNKDLCSKE